MLCREVSARRGPGARPPNRDAFNDERRCLWRIDPFGVDPFEVVRGQEVRTRGSLLP